MERLNQRTRSILNSDKLLWRGLYYEYWITVPFFPETIEFSWKYLFRLRIEITSLVHTMFTSSIFSDDQFNKLSEYLFVSRQESQTYLYLIFIDIIFYFFFYFF